MRTSQRLALGMILALAVFATVDHLQWAWACTLPLSRGDSPRHALFALTRAHGELADPSFLGLRLLLEPTYYPSLVPWLAQPLLKLPGAGALDYRASLAVFSGLFTLGAGLAARRAWGSAAGVAAAGLSLAVPVLWSLRPELMLDGPLAAMVLLFLATVPLKATTPGRVLLAGLVLGAGLLTKQTMPYLAAPALAVLALRAVWTLDLGRGPRLGLLVALGTGLVGAAAIYVAGQGWLAVGLVALGCLGVALGGRRLGADHLADLALVALVAVVLAGPWYARSVGPVLEGLVLTRQDHADVPSLLSRPGAMRAASMVRFGVLGLLPAPAQWACLAGIGGLLISGRGRLLGLASLAAAVGGAALIATFPDLHGRHFAPVAGPLILLAAAPVGLLAGRWPRVGAATAAPAVIFGLVFALAWRVEGESVYRVSSADAEIPANATAHSLGELGRLMAQPVGVGTYLSAAPPEGELPVHAMLEALAADRPASPVVVVSMSTLLEGDAMLLGAEELGVGGLIVPDRAGAGQVLDMAEARNGVYAVELVATTRRSRGLYRASQELVRLGFEEVGRWPATLPGAPALELVLHRWEPEVEPGG